MIGWFTSFTPTVTVYPGHEGMLTFHVSPSSSQDAPYTKTNGFIQLSLPPAPFLDLYHQLQDYYHFDPPLKMCSEAHITIMTPPEYAFIKGIISIDELHQWMKQHEIQQNAQYKGECLGKVPGAGIGDVFFIGYFF